MKYVLVKRNCHHCLLKMFFCKHDMFSVHQRPIFIVKRCFFMKMLQTWGISVSKFGCEHCSDGGSEARDWIKFSAPRSLLEHNDCYHPIKRRLVRRTVTCVFWDRNVVVLEPTHVIIYSSFYKSKRSMVTQDNLEWIINNWACDGNRFWVTCPLLLGSRP